MVDWNEQKRKAFDSMLLSIKTATEKRIGVDKGLLIDAISLDFGFNVKRAGEYLDTLIRSGKILEKNSLLWARKT